MLKSFGQSTNFCSDLATLGSFLPNSKSLYPSSTGLGFALSYTPAIAMVGRYFNERKALAYGIALSGSDIFTYLLFCSLVIYTSSSSTFLLTNFICCASL